MKILTLSIPLFVSCMSATAVAAQPPNVLLILADDVGSDAIGCYGGQSYPTPHIDRLAAEGKMFHHAYAMPVCHPTRICVMTGRYPVRFGAEGSKWGDFPKSAESFTIAQCMKQAGYTTAVAGKWQLSLMKSDLNQPRRMGFDQWSLFGWHEGARYNDPFVYENGKLRDDTDGAFGPDLYVDFLIEFMRQSQAEGRPFFAYYPMALCHAVTNDLKGRHVAWYRDGRWMNFAEMMAVTDDMVGRLVGALNEMQIREQTVILFTTDNGTAGATYLTVNEAGKMIQARNVSVRDGKVVPGGKGRFDDTGTRVPLIANWPGRIPPGSQTSSLVDMTDFLPTLKELAKAPADGVLRDGVSFASELNGSEGRSRRRWIHLQHRARRGVRSRDWKLYDDGRFFDLRTDPMESKPLNVAELRDEAKRHHVELQAVLSEVAKPLP